MQLPQDLPTPTNNSPINPSSPLELAVFIALPILLIIAYLMLRKKKKKGQ